MKRFLILFYVSLGFSGCGESQESSNGLFGLDFSSQSTSVTANELKGFWEVSSSDSFDASISCDYRLKIEEENMTISARVRGNGMISVTTQSVSINIVGSQIIPNANLSIYVETDVDSQGLYYFCPPSAAPLEFKSGVAMPFVLNHTKLSTSNFGSLRKIADLTD